MKLAPILGILLLISAPVISQKSVTPTQKLKVVLPGTDGTNAASVAWNPKNKVYYTCFAGNDDFPLYMFSPEGSITKTMTTGRDTRGFWFNEKENVLEGTLWGGLGEDDGYFYRDINSDGVPGDDHYKKFPSMQYFDDNAVPAYNQKKDELIYLKDHKAWRVSHKDGSDVGSVALQLPSGADWDDINQTSIIYTGMKKAQLGVFDSDKGKIYLFNEKNGACTKQIVMPEEAPDPKNFSFAYANGMFWLFSTYSRTWYAYSI